MKKFIFNVDVSGIRPVDVPEYIKKVKVLTAEFFGKGRVLYVPVTKDSLTSIEEVEV
jgi:hypothetical protein